MSLDSLLLEVVNKSPSYMESWGFSFQLMYLTGCRHGEIDPRLWETDGADAFLLHCLKHSEVRRVLRSELTPELCGFLESRDLTRFVLSRSTLTRAFNRLTFPYRLRSFDCYIFLHAFRFNRIKAKYVELGSVEAVRQWVGHVEIKNTRMYIEKNVNIIKI